MIVNSNRFCPLGDLCTDRTTCVLPHGWEKKTVWRRTKVRKRVEFSEEDRRSLVRNDFQLFSHAGKYYLPDSAKNLYLKVSGLCLLVPTLAGFRVVSDASFFFGYLGLAAYGTIKKAITTQSSELEQGFHGMSESLFGLFRTVVVFAPLMLSLAGMLFFPYQMKTSVARLEKWWVQEKEGDETLHIMNISKIYERIRDRETSTMKTYAAWCFQPIRVEDRHIYQGGNADRSSAKVTKDQSVYFTRRLTKSEEGNYNLVYQGQGLVALDF